jgi:hypothetical protein
MCRRFATGVWYFYGGGGGASEKQVSLRLRRFGMTSAIFSLEGHA